MDQHFISAMGAAIRARQERPPAVGISRKPDTRNPQFIRPVALPVNGSVSGDLAALGDGGLTGFAPRQRVPITLAGRGQKT